MQAECSRTHTSYSVVTNLFFFFTILFFLIKFYTSQDDRRQHRGCSENKYSAVSLASQVPENLVKQADVMVMGLSLVIFRFCHDNIHYDCTSRTSQCFSAVFHLNAGSKFWGFFRNLSYLPLKT